MHPSASSIAVEDHRFLSPRRLLIIVTAALWITFACALPFQSAREARRQAHLRLNQVLTEGKPNTENVVAAFDRATQNVISASTVPCLGLGVCVLLLVHQQLKLKRRYNALENDLRACRNDTAPADEAELD